MTELVNPGQREMLILYSRPRLSSNRTDTDRENSGKKKDELTREVYVAVTEASVCPRNQTILRQGGRARRSISHKTIHADTEPNYKQGPKPTEGSTTAWLSSIACRDDQQGKAAKLVSVDIDQIGESGETGRQLYRWLGDGKRQTEEVH